MKLGQSYSSFLQLVDIFIIIIGASFLMCCHYGGLFAFPVV